MAELARRCRPLLGTFVEVTCEHDRIADAAFAAVGRVQALMSAHDPTSDLGAINAGAHRGGVRVHRWTREVIARALDWARLSGGAFDPVRAGGRAIALGFLPRHPGQPEPDGQADWTGLHVEGDRIRLEAAACIDLGGIAKGFAVDKAVEAMTAAGAACGLVNAGGDVRGFGPEPWPITIVDPVSRRPAVEVRLAEMALATSAALPGESPSGLDFRHLMGAGRGRLSTTVRAPSACDADALTKIVMAGSGTALSCLAAAEASALVLCDDGRVVAVEPDLAEAA